MSKMVAKIMASYSKSKALVLSACLVAFASLMVVPGLALATESATEEKLKTVTTQVSTEGVSILLAVLTGLAALIAAVIIIPKAIGFIRRFV